MEREPPPAAARPPATDRSPRGEDRRARPTPMLSRFLLRGRRRGGRRDGETSNVYVDRPGTLVLVALGTLLVLSLADAYFTLAALSLGATEANPLMRATLALGNGAFVVVKTLVTFAGGAFLALHRTWRLGRACLCVAVLAYLALTGWHLYGRWVVLPSPAQRVTARPASAGPSIARPR